MKKSENHPQRMNSNNDEGSSSASSTKKTKSKSRRSGESSSGKPQPNTSVKASYVGRDVEVRLKNNKIIQGICVDPGLGPVFKLHNAYVTPGAGFEPFVYSKNVHHPELQLPTQDIVDVKATLGNPKKKFATDGEYSTSQNDNDENFKLVQWDGGESSEQPLDHGSTSRGGGGWSVEEMFKKNETLGVQTTFKDDLTQYTTCEPVGSEEDKIRAARIAREIETNDKSKRLAFLENDDEERDLDKETSVPDGPGEKGQTSAPPASVENQEDISKKKFQFNPDAPAFIPKPPPPAQSAPVGIVSIVPQHPPLMPQPPPPNNNQPQQYIVASNVGMQPPPGSVVTSTYMQQQIPVMPIYNHQIINNPQQMQAIPPLIQTHPQNIIIRGEYPNAYIQANPLQVQHMPVYRMAMPAQAPQHQQLSQPQHQQPITVYQIQPQVPQQQQQHYNQIIHQQQQPQQLIQQHQPRHLNHYSSGNHYSGNNGGGNGNGGRTRRNNNNHHGNNNWHQNTQSTSQSHQPQHVNQPRYQQVLPQTPVYMPQMGHVYVNQNAAITSSSSNNVVPINMIPQHYTMPQQVYQRIDANNMNGMVAVQPQQLQQNTIMVAPNMGMPQHQIHHGGPQIMHSQPQTPAPSVNHQGASPPMHFPPNLNVPPPPIQKKMVHRYAMQAPNVMSNPSQIRITPLMGTSNKGPRMGTNNGGPPQYRRSNGRRRD